MGTTTSTVLVDTYQTYYSKKLLDHATHELRLNEFAMEAELPKNIGAKTIRWFRKPQADATQVQTLTEGTPISNFREVPLTPIEATLVQYGEAAKITDIVDMTGLFDALQQNIETMGEDCALHSDGATRDVLCHASTGLTKMYAQSLANFAAVAGATAANAKIVPGDLLRAGTKLQINLAKKLNGNWVAILAPQHAYDIKNHDDFVDVVKYKDTIKIYKGEIGTLWGVRCVEATNPFQEDETEGTYASSFSGAGTNTTGFIYTSIITGKGAYGTPKLSGTQSPWKPKVMIVPPGKAEKADPLGQYGTAGWKSYWVSKVLNSSFGIALRGKTEFVG